MFKMHYLIFSYKIQLIWNGTFFSSMHVIVHLQGVNKGMCERYICGIPCTFVLQSILKGHISNQAWVIFQLSGTGKRCMRLEKKYCYFHWWKVGQERYTWVVNCLKFGRKKKRNFLFHTYHKALSLGCT